MTRILFCQSNRYFNTFLWLILAALMTPLAARAEWQIVITTPDKGHYTHPVIQSYEGESWDESVTYDMEYPMGSAGSYFFQNWPSLNPFEGKIDINVSLTAKLIWAGGGDQSSSSSSSSFSAPPRVIYIKETLSASAGSQGPTYKRGPSGEPDDAVETPLIPSMTAELGSADGFQVSRVDDSEGDSQSKTVTGTKITRYEVPEEPNANGNWEITIARSPHAMVSATGWRQGYMSCGVGWDISVPTFNVWSNIETSFTKGYPTNGGSWGFIPVEIKNPADNKTLESVVTWNEDRDIWEGQAYYSASTNALTVPQYHWKTSGAPVFAASGASPNTCYELPPYYEKTFRFDLGSDWKAFPKSTAIDVTAAEIYADPANSLLKGKFNVKWHFEIEEWEPDSSRPIWSEPLGHTTRAVALGEKIEWQNNDVPTSATVAARNLSVYLIDIAKAVIKELGKVEKVLLESIKLWAIVETGSNTPQTDSIDTPYDGWKDAVKNARAGNNQDSVYRDVKIIENLRDIPSKYSPSDSANDSQSGFIKVKCVIKRKLWHHPYRGDKYNPHGYEGETADEVPVLGAKEKILVYRWEGIGEPGGE